MSAEKRWFRSFLTSMIWVFVPLGFIFVYIGIGENDVRPIVVLAAFVVIFTSVYLYAKRPGVLIGYPDRPRRWLGARPVIIPRSHCQFPGCENRTTLAQCSRCRHTFCQDHLKQHLPRCRGLFLQK